MLHVAVSFVKMFYSEFASLLNFMKSISQKFMNLNDTNSLVSFYEKLTQWGLRSYGLILKIITYILN